MGLAAKLAASGPPVGAAPTATVSAVPPAGSYPSAAAPGGLPPKPAQSPYGQQPAQQVPYGTKPGATSSPYGQPQTPYGAPQQSPYGQPQSQQQSPYGQQGQQQQYGAPQGQYGAPQGQYGVPQGQYGAPQNQYGAPQNQYGAPQGQYGAPQGQYGAPQGQYGAPQGQFGAPAQGAYGAPAAAAGAAAGAAGGSGNYLSLLQKAVQENQLQAFYPPGSLEQIAARIGGQLQQIAQLWRLPMEIAVDLVRLALYDIVLFVDDSGSMAFEENGERIDDLKLILARVAYAASLFDQDGIEVRFMNSQTQGNGVNSEQAASQLVSQIRFAGLTPLGTNLNKKVIEPLVIGPARNGQMKKPVLVISITDGQPAGEDPKTVFRVIRGAKQAVAQSRYGPGAVAFQFAQVGNDLKAREFLGALDTDREVGNLVDCTSNFESEQDEMARLGVNLTPETWLVKLLMGAIDRSYDTQDEQGGR